MEESRNIFWSLIASAELQTSAYGFGKPFQHALSVVDAQNTILFCDFNLGLCLCALRVFQASTLRSMAFCAGARSDESKRSTYASRADANISLPDFAKDFMNVVGILRLRDCNIVREKPWYQDDRKALREKW